MNKRLNSTELYQGQIINLRVDEVRLPDGRLARREIVEHPGAAATVPLDDKGRLYLVRQYRDAVGESMLEIPAGKLHPGEDPEKCARRELREELGLVPGRLTHLATFFSSPGFCDEIMHVYLAEELAAEEEQSDREEFLEPEIRSLDDVASLLAELRDGKSLAGILLALRHLHVDTEPGSSGVRGKLE